MSAAQNKAVRGCIKDEGKARLQSTVEACLTADPNLKVQGKQDKVTALFASGGACEGDAGTDLVTNASTINTAHVDHPNGLVHDIFGPDLDGGQIVQTSPGTQCQYGIAQRAGQMFDAWVKEFRKCKKAAMKDGAATEAAVVTACVSAAAVRGSGSGLSDAKSKVALRGDKLADTVGTKCATLDLDAVAPGACVGGGRRMARRGRNRLADRAGEPDRPALVDRDRRSSARSA